MFNAKCVISKDKDGKPYQFRAKRFSLLLSLCLSLWLLWIVSTIVTFLLIFFVSVPTSAFGVILLSALILFVFTILVFIIARDYSLTVESPKLIYKDADKLVVLDLSLTKMKFEGLTIILSEGKKEVQIFYLSKEINDALVKFLGEVGVTDLSQKEEPS